MFVMNIWRPTRTMSKKPAQYFKPLINVVGYTVSFRVIEDHVGAYFFSNYKKFPKCFPSVQKMYIACEVFQLTPHFVERRKKCMQCSKGKVNDLV